MRSPFPTFVRGAAALIVLLASISCGEERATEPSSESLSLSDSPALIPCPTLRTIRTQALVTPLGGVVSLGGTSITIPAGGVRLPTLLSVTIPASRYMEIRVRANGLTHFLFEQPVSITLDYSRCKRPIFDNRPLEVWYIDAATKELLENMNGVDDKTTKSITFTTGHLSNYAVAF